MKAIRTSIVSALIMSMFATTGLRAEDGLGVGVIIGEPTGLSLKKWVSADTAFDAAAAWSFSENDSFQLHADYLIHRFQYIKPEPPGGKMPIYFGIGARVKFKDSENSNGRNEDDTLVGIRIPVGIAYLFQTTPIEIFAEIVPVVDVAPDTDFVLTGAFGARYYFR